MSWKVFGTSAQLKSWEIGTYGNRTDAETSARWLQRAIGTRITVRVVWEERTDNA